MQSSLHPPSHVAERVLAAADAFAKDLSDMPEATVVETAQAFANKMREPDQSVYVKSERIADEVQLFACDRMSWLSSVQVFDRTYRFSRRLEMAQVFERVTKVSFITHFISDRHLLLQFRLMLWHLSMII